MLIPFLLTWWAFRLGGKLGSPAEPWADLPKLLALARYDNVVVKISGAGTLSK